MQSVTLADLFRDMPVRREFRSVEAELRFVVDALIPLAAVNSRVTFRVIDTSRERVLLELRAVCLLCRARAEMHQTSPEARHAEIWGRRLEDVRAVSQKDGAIAIRGSISRAEVRMPRTGLLSLTWHTGGRRGQRGQSAAATERAAHSRRGADWFRVACVPTSPHKAAQGTGADVRARHYCAKGDIRSAMRATAYTSRRSQLVMGTAAASVRWRDGGSTEAIRNCIWSAIVGEGQMVARKPNELPSPAPAPELTQSYRRVVIPDKADATPRDLKAILGV